MNICLAYFCCTHEIGRTDDWLTRLTAAGHDVSSLEIGCSWDEMCSRLSSSDVVIMTLDYGISAGTKWAVVLTCAIEGRNTWDHSGDRWMPSPTYLWQANLDQHGGRWFHPGLSQGAIDLATDFNAAVQQVINDLHNRPGLG